MKSAANSQRCFPLDHHDVVAKKKTKVSAKSLAQSKQTYTQTFNKTKKLLRNKYDFRDFLTIYNSLNALLINIDISSDVIILISEYSVGNIVECNLCKLLTELPLPNVNNVVFKGKEMLILNGLSKYEINHFKTTGIYSNNIGIWLNSIRKEYNFSIKNNDIKTIINENKKTLNQRGIIICRECKNRFNKFIYPCDGCGLWTLGQDNTNREFSHCSDCAITREYYAKSDRHARNAWQYSFKCTSL